jgi:hypothetical protein
MKTELSGGSAVDGGIVGDGKIAQVPTPPVTV